MQQLRETPDEELIAIHNRLAVHTTVGTAYYMDELHRRETVRAMKATERPARASLWLSAANAIVAIVAVVVAVAASG